MSNIELEVTDYLPGLNEPASVMVHTRKPGRTDLLLTQGRKSVIDVQKTQNTLSNRESLFFGPTSLLVAEFVDGEMQIISPDANWLEQRKLKQDLEKLAFFVSIFVPDSPYSELGVAMAIGNPLQEKMLVNLAQTNKLFQVRVAEAELAAMKAMESLHKDPILTFSTGQNAKAIWDAKRDSTRTVDLMIRSLGVWDTNDIKPRDGTLGHDAKFAAEKEIMEYFGINYDDLARLIELKLEDPKSFARAVEPFGLQVTEDVDAKSLARMRHYQASAYEQFMIQSEARTLALLEKMGGINALKNPLWYLLYSTRPYPPSWGEQIVLMGNKYIQITKGSFVYGMGMIEASRVDFQRKPIFPARYSDQEKFNYYQLLKHTIRQSLVRKGWRG